MAKPTPFEIHVDGSCLSQSSDKENTMPHASERISSTETIVHHDLGPQQDEHTEPSNHLQDKLEDEARERRVKKISAEIQAAARAVVNTIEHDDFDNESSVLSVQTDGSYEDSELTHETVTDQAYGNGTELPYESEVEGEHQSGHNSEHAGDSSSHREDDISDDVFSSSNRSSARSSINSADSLHNSSSKNQKHLTSPGVGEEAGSSIHDQEEEEGEEAISRIPSGTSYLPPSSLNLDNDRTPSKILNRPPFRTPSSVRAMQYSPTQSIFSSPRSTKRHMPTVSRLGTPNSHSSPSKRTPTRFKPKKENPLVLLHVTVLPLHWVYSHLMASPDIPESLQSVKESWKLLQSKLGDTVFERGVLLAHPQDSYEVLEERLLEALELPVRPRAKILRCGHYIGPIDSDASSEDGESGNSWAGEQPDWCDICRRTVRLDDLDTDEIQGTNIRFRLKFYASNGLMRAGAWAAAWREMERVDVEIEPFVDANLVADLEDLALVTPAEEVQSVQPHAAQTEEDDGFVDEEESTEIAERELTGQETPEEEVRIFEEQVRAKIAEEKAMRKKMADDDFARQVRLSEEREIKQRLEEEERKRIARMAEELGIRQRVCHESEDRVRRGAVEEDGQERVREMYNHSHTHESTSAEPHRRERSQNQAQQTTTQKSTVRGDESLSELLLAAAKVAMRDSKNIAILVLVFSVLFLALRPTFTPNTSVQSLATSPAANQQSIISRIEIVPVVSDQVAGLSASAIEAELTSSVSVVVVTETVKVREGQIETKTVIQFQEKTVTEMVSLASPSPSSSSSAPISVEPISEKYIEAIVMEQEAISPDPEPILGEEPLEIEIAIQPQTQTQEDILSESVEELEVDEEGKDKISIVEEMRDEDEDAVAKAVEPESESRTAEIETQLELEIVLEHEHRLEHEL